MRYLRTILFVCSIIMSASLLGQKNSAYQQYIDKYKSAAIDQMRRYKIPASITLSQALLESGAGSSYLATKANNHFGIKVGGGWKGSYVKRDDDSKGEHFRKYKSVDDSYEDHSQFLLKDRYKPLFRLDPLDYKAWARGLKACGYATLPTYAERLIRIIEIYELYQYDEDQYGMRPRKKKEIIEIVEYSRHPITSVNGINCIVARQGDTWKELAKETKVSKRKLLSYNEVNENFVIPAGMHIFLAKKAKKADSKYKDTWHKVKNGESMYSISQYYGIRMKNLYKMNFKDADYTPVTGDLLKVR